MLDIEDTRAIRMTTQTAMIANEKQTNEQTDEDKEDQKS
jgi:hypothetical protein